MPLVKHGKITSDTLVHVADDAEIPGDGAILIPAARFLEDPEGLSRGVARTGVICPKNCDVDALRPYLDRFAAIAVMFPPLPARRAYRASRLPQEQHGCSGGVRT